MCARAQAFTFKGPPYACLGLFAGKMAVSKAYKQKLQRACALDIDLDDRDVPCMDAFVRVLLSIVRTS